VRNSRQLGAKSRIGGLVAVALVLAACAAPPTPTATPTSPPDPEPPPGVPRAASPPDRATLVHRVRPGETLTGIAKNYAVDVAYLVQANHLADADHLAVGQSLRVPALGDGDRAEALVEQAAIHYRNARFDAALAQAQQAEAILAVPGDEEHLRRLGARAAFIAGCALAAFGEDERALAAFTRVRALYPQFEPPAGWLSPRLEKLYLAARNP
jgi:LysM repeat protein